MGSCVAGSGRQGKRAHGMTNNWSMPGFWPVFPSLCDPFDNEVPHEWRLDLWALIRRTPCLTWLLLTKRIGNVEKMHPGGEYQNVWIGASIVNQEEADRDMPKLLQVRGVAKRFVSYEPALGPVDFGLGQWVGLFTGRIDDPPTPTIDQIIVGGESKQGGKEARPFDIAWARSTVKQCRDAGVAPFVKQLGAFPVQHHEVGTAKGDSHIPIKLKDRAGADPTEWPEDLRVQHFPE